ncbi:MAG TPA: UDP-N-acetylmuramate--L-alanine ligase [Candidatus Dormibacteraeota bacterium]|nr:UDP-N-acetylmuramate--L-alanine ligase [Candidatus Dormibacteraeota bacterium]
MTDQSRHVHFLGICGYAVSGAALLARQLGYTVTGSDEDAYPPTTDTLTAAGIPWTNTHGADNLDRWGTPDLVVVGNQVRAGNVEWEEARRRGLPTTSEAEFYGELTADRIRVAVCGTHGKSTTSSLLAHMLEVAGMSPGFRLGVTSRDFGVSARLGSGRVFVIEGDEYTTAPWDSRPKFLHAHPELACVTRLELDHPDVYASFEAYKAPFLQLAATMPSSGLLVLCADDAQCVSLASHAGCEVTTYGEAEGADWRIVPESNIAGAGTQRFTVVSAGQRIALELNAPGAHNRQNAVAALVLALRLGAALPACLEACRGFRGAARRYEVVGRPGGVVVVDDYAHHPTEVAATVSAARGTAEGRVIAVYVPHTYSRTLTLLADYATSFAGADEVMIGPIEPARERHLAGTVSSADVAEVACASAPAISVAGSDEALARVVDSARAGDVVLCMSVRGFDDFARRAVTALEGGRRQGGGPPPAGAPAPGQEAAP